MNDTISFSCPKCGGPISHLPTSEYFNCDHCGRLLYDSFLAQRFTEGSIKCPICKNSSTIKKMSSMLREKGYMPSVENVVNFGSYSKSTTDPDNRISSLEREIEAKRSNPTNKGCFTCFMMAIVSIIILIILERCTSSFTSNFIYGDNSLNAYDPVNWLSKFLFASLIIMAIAGWFIFVLPGLIKKEVELSQLEKTLAQLKDNKDITSPVEVVDEITQKEHSINLVKWMDYYYCSTDDIIFHPQSKQMFSPEEFQRFIK